MPQRVPVQADLHRASLCLVDEAFRLGLEHDRATQAGGGMHGLW